MALALSDQLARTIEFQTAVIHLHGELAGAIEVPIYVGRLNRLHGDLEDLLLQVDGERELLSPARREFFRGKLRLMYFSDSIRKTRRLPSTLQLCWGDSEGDPDETCGMGLSFEAAPAHRGRDE